MMVIIHISIQIAVKFPCGLPVSSSRSLLDLWEESDELTNTDYNITTPSLPSTTPTMSTPRSSNESLAVSHSNETARPQTMDKLSVTMSTQHSGEIGNGTRSYKSISEYGHLNNSATNLKHTNKTNNGHGYTESLEDEHARIVGGMLCELGQCPWQVCYTLKQINICRETYKISQI